MTCLQAKECQALPASTSISKKQGTMESGGGENPNSMLNNSVFVPFFALAVDQPFWGCGCWTSSTWELVGSAISQAPPQT